MNDSRINNPWIPVQDGGFSLWSALQLFLMGYGAYCLIGKTGKAIINLIRPKLLEAGESPKHDGD